MLKYSFFLSSGLFGLDKIRADTSNEVSAPLFTFAFEIIDHVTMGKCCCTKLRLRCREEYRTTCGQEDGSHVWHARTVHIQ